MGVAVPALIPVLGSRGRLEAEADRDGKFQNSQVYIETLSQNPKQKRSVSILFILLREN